jgi:hypothetical protein
LAKGELFESSNFFSICRKRALLRPDIRYAKPF